LIATKASEFTVTNKRVLIMLRFIRPTSIEVLLSAVQEQVAAVQEAR
jgi:hypothetical protein